MIPYVRNHYPVRTQSLYDTYAFISICYRPKIIISLISLIRLRARYLGYIGYAYVSRLRAAEKMSGLRVAEISAGAISLYEGIITN